MSERHLVLVKEGERVALAEYIAQLWHAAYDELLGKEQVDYMTAHFQSAGAIAGQIAEDNYIYFYITERGKKRGYVAVVPEPSRLFLSKLYLDPDLYGRGLGQTILGEIAHMARRLGLDSVYLTVNKGNARAIRAYEKFGFVRTDSAVTDIGNGFVMDDYVYEYKLA